MTKLSAPLRNAPSILFSFLLMMLPSLILAAENDREGLTDSRKSVKTSTDIFLVALPAAAVAGTLISEDWEGLKQGALTAVTAVGVTYILKYAVSERRPDGSDFHSFPSAHSSITFAAAGYLQRRYGWKFGGPAYAVAAYTAWGRTYAKKHHWWDVVSGAAIGVGSAYIFTHPYMRQHEVSVLPFADGNVYGFNASFVF